MEDRMEGCKKPVWKFRKNSDDDDGERGCDSCGVGGREGF